MGCALLAALAASARAADTAPRLVLVESHAPRAPERAFITRLRAELRVLGIEVQVRRARSPNLQHELWKMTGKDTAMGAAPGAALCADSAVAAIRPDAFAATLLFVSAPTGQLSSFQLGGSEASDPTAWALQAAEVLRPELLGSVALAARPDALASAPPTALGSDDGDSNTPQPASAALDAELPPALQPAGTQPRAAMRPARFSSALGLGLLVSGGFMRPAPLLSLLMGVRASRLLSVDLLALMPLSAVTREATEATIGVRASMLGLDVGLAVYRHPRWDLGFALGAALAIVAFARSDEPPSSQGSTRDGWSRDIAPSVFARLGSGVQIARALSLRIDLSAGMLIHPTEPHWSKAPARVDLSTGTLIDPNLHSSNAPAPSWGRLWLAAALGLAAAFP